MVYHLFIFWKVSLVINTLSQFSIGCSFSVQFMDRKLRPPVTIFQPIRTRIDNIIVLQFSRFYFQNFGKHFLKAMNKNKGAKHLSLKNMSKFLVLRMGKNTKHEWYQTTPSISKHHQGKKEQAVVLSSVFSKYTKIYSIEARPLVHRPSTMQQFTVHNKFGQKCLFLVQWGTI